MKYGPNPIITKEEAEAHIAFLVRLRRAWNLDDGTLSRDGSKDWIEYHFKVQGHEVQFTTHPSYTSAYMYRGTIREGPPILMCRVDAGDVVVESGETYKGDSRYITQQELDRAFAAQWMPFFRRACWVMGCPLEASAHEKAEWIQGFSQEELEAWNLKI